MSLHSAFDSLLASDQPLTQLDELIWKNLVAAAHSDEHPWSQGCFSTVTLDASRISAPRTRTVILRRADQQSQSIDFYTDVRSAKVNEIESSETKAQVSWLFYHRSTKIQLRLEGTADLINGPEADVAWQNTPLRSRSAYLSIDPPGEVATGPNPPDTSDRIVTQVESERGQANFRIVRTTVLYGDWLYLKREGHVRASLDFSDTDRVHPRWLVP